MMIYPACFVLSALFAHLANKSKKRSLFILFSIISIALPVMLAGFRDFSIGIDTKNYLFKEYYWLGVRKYGFRRYLELYPLYGRGEYGFGLLLAVLGSLTSNFRVFLFLAHSIIVTAVYVGAFRHRKQVDPALVLLLFYLFFFNHSLNIIRQYMAMAVIFAFFKDVTEGKYLRFCIVAVLMTTIHSASFLALGIPLLHCFLYGSGEDGAYRLGKLSFLSYDRFSMTARKLTVCGGLALAVALIVPGVRLLISLGIIGEKYNYYIRISSTEYSGIVSFMLVVELIAIFLVRKRMRQECGNFDFRTTLTAVYLILLQLSAFIFSGRRIALFFALPNLLTLCYLGQAGPELLSRFLPCKPKMLAALSKALVVGAGVVYWLFFYVSRNASQTVPYLSVFSR